MTNAPLQYLGNGEFKTPKGHALRLDRELVIGEILHWQEIKDRSGKSHRFYFATVYDYWLNLPEAIAVEFPNSESLRHYALIKTGWCTVQKLVCANNAEALKAVVLVTGLDAFCLCEVAGNILTVYRARSQAYRAMKKDEFQKSSKDVLDLLEHMVGAKADEQVAA